MTSAISALSVSAPRTATNAKHQARAVPAAAVPSCKRVMGGSVKALRVEGSRSAVKVAARSQVVKVMNTASMAVEASKLNKPVFPFVKIVGQEDMKLGLILNIVDPTLGGVLIMGDRGTGKSMAVRSLVDILPYISVVQGDNYNSNPDNPAECGPESKERHDKGETMPRKEIKLPIVELPLGATEDRVCGTIDIEKALSDGVKAYEPGLLAKANRGILYVDEVNLLEDGLVDVVLDSAASGWNTVEREGVSISHPARFIMVGSGSDEEGELRPQLLDRFGLNVQVRTIMNMEERIDLATSRMNYDMDPGAYVNEHMAESKALEAKLQACRELLPQVTLDPSLCLKISEVCSYLNVDGLRGDIVTTRCAKAHAAWEGRTVADGQDVARVIVMCLSHRLRKDPMDKMDGGYKVVMAYNRIFGQNAPRVATTPEADLIQMQQEKAAKKEEEEKNAEPKAKKAGSWGGL